MNHKLEVVCILSFLTEKRLLISDPLLKPARVISLFQKDYV